MPNIKKSDKLKFTQNLVDKISSSSLSAFFASSKTRSKAINFFSNFMHNVNTMSREDQEKLLHVHQFTSLKKHKTWKYKLPFNLSQISNQGHYLLTWINQDSLCKMIFKDRTWVNFSEERNYSDSGTNKNFPETSTPLKNS